MTGNQIAYASTRENVRHNQAMEEETHRHNVVTENLADTANIITADANRWKMQYESRRNDLQEDYNKQYLALQTAQGNERLAIESRLATIKQQMADADQTYKIQMADVAAADLALKQDIADEQKRANEARETLNAYDLFLKEKRQEYESTYWREQTALAHEANLIKLAQTESQVQLNNADIILKESQSQLNESLRRLNATNESWVMWDKGWGMVSDVLRLFK